MPFLIVAIGVASPKIMMLSVKVMVCRLRLVMTMSSVPPAAVARRERVTRDFGSGVRWSVTVRASLRKHAALAPSSETAISSGSRSSIRTTNSCTILWSAT